MSEAEQTTQWLRGEERHEKCRYGRLTESFSAVVFVNSKLTTSSGAELRVPVKVFQDKPGIVTSAYYAEANTHGVVIWKRGGDE